MTSAADKSREQKNKKTKTLDYFKAFFNLYEDQIKAVSIIGLVFGVTGSVLSLGPSAPGGFIWVGVIGFTIGIPMLLILAARLLESLNEIWSEVRKEAQDLSDKD